MRQHRLRGLRGPAIERPEACDHRPEGGPGGPHGCAARRGQRTLVARQRNLPHANAAYSILP